MKRFSLTFALLLCLCLTWTSAKASIVLPRSLTAVETQAFYADLAVTEAVIPSGCTSIGAFAFANCKNLRWVTIPESVTAIDYSAFLGCDQVFIFCETGSEAEHFAERMGYPHAAPDVVATGTCGASITWNLSTDGCLMLEGTGATSTGQFRGGSDINLLWGDYGAQIKSVLVGAGITKIGTGAFSSLEALETVRLPDSVTTIGDGAFECCTALTDISLPQGIAEIPVHCFVDCVKLRSIAIPDSVTGIGSFAFEGCTALTKIVLPEGLRRIDSCAFMRTGLESIHLPDSLETLASEAFSESLLKLIRLPGAIAGIDPGLFEGCAHLEQVEIPNGPTYIGNRAFADCAALKNVGLPETITSLGTSAFKGTPALTHIVVPDGVTVLPENTFAGCTALTDVTLPQSLRRIGSGAFTGCAALEKLIVSAGVTEIAADAFEACDNLTIYAKAGSEAARAAQTLSLNVILSGGGWQADANDLVCGNGHVYRYIMEPMTYAEAEAYCESLGGHLLSINDDDEQSIIYSWCLDLICGMNTHPIRIGIWLGLTAQTGFKQWEDGTQVEYTKWTDSMFGGDVYLSSIIDGRQIDTKWDRGRYGVEDTLTVMGYGDDDITAPWWNPVWYKVNSGELTFICEFDGEDDEPTWCGKLAYSKGRTEIVLTRDDNFENNRYAWTMTIDTIQESRSGNVPSKKPIYDVNEGQKTIRLDLSTDLGLTSGEYALSVINQATEKKVEVLRFSYDEAVRLVDDDLYGNEREFRRLVTFSRYENRLSDAAIVNNMLERFQNYGFERDRAFAIVDAFANCPAVYRNLFLYIFYKTSLTAGISGTTEFRENGYTLYINVTQHLLDSPSSFACTFIHEYGHAIDYISGMTISEGYHTTSVNLDELYNNGFTVDLEKAVRDAFNRWRTKNPAVELSGTEDAFIQQVIFTLIGLTADGQNHFDSNITRNDCPGMSDSEYNAYKAIEKLLRDQMPGDLDFGLPTNADMRDILCGWTQNKIKKSSDVGDAHNAQFWTIRTRLFTEGWAEFYAGCVLCDGATTGSNSYWFPETCQAYAQEAGMMLQVLRQQF